MRENKCPQCGSDLILRKGKLSTFLGCTHYPKCTHTIQLQ
ncbi:topoisomerase DNA-binding C4 zinc finger domain-containing protein [Flavobacterium sp.]